MRPPRLRSSSAVRLASLATLGVFLAAAALFGMAALNLSHALSPETFAAHVGRGIGRSLSVESVALEFRPAPRVRVEGVAIGGLGTAAAAEIALRFRPLLDGRIVARSVRFEDLDVTLSRGPDGAFEPIFVAPEGASEPDLAALPRFEAERGEIRIVQGENVSAVIGLRTLSLGRFDAASSAALVLAGQVGGGDGGWTIQPLRLRGRLVQQAERMALLDGRLHAEEAHIRWWSGRDVRGRFHYEDGRVEVESLDVASHGGRWHAEGPIHLRGGTRLALDIVLEDVAVGALLTAARPGESFGDLGRLRTRWRLDVPWQHGPRFERGAGQGHVEVVGGILPSRSFSTVIRERLGLAPRRLSTPVKTLVAPVTLHEGLLHSDDAHLLTEDYELRVAGSLALDRTLDLSGTLFLATLPDLPVTITGKLPHPDVETHIGRLPKDGLGAIAGAVKRTGATLARSTASAGEWLRGTMGGSGEEPDQAAPSGPKPAKAQ